MCIRDRVVICSSGHYWRENGSGYTNAQMAGVYTRDKAYKAAGHCGPEKYTSFHDVPKDHIPTLRAELAAIKADRDKLLAVLVAGKLDRWAATFGSDAGRQFETTEWVLAAEAALTERGK